MWCIVSVCIQQQCVPLLQLHVVESVSENIGIEMFKIEKVVVGGEKRSTSAEIKAEPAVVPLQSCKMIFLCMVNVWTEGWLSKSKGFDVMQLYLPTLSVCILTNWMYLIVMQISMRVYSVFSASSPSAMPKPRRDTWGRVIGTSTNSSCSR